MRGLLAAFESPNDELGQRQTRLLSDCVWLITVLVPQVFLREVSSLDNA